MTDYYRARVEEVFGEVVTLYGHAMGALEAVNPDALEQLIVQRQALLVAMRELSVEDYFGRATEPWLIALADDAREAERAFEEALKEEFTRQRTQMGTMEKNRKARRAYNSAA